VATQRTTLTLPPDLLRRAKQNGITNISQFCARALEAYLDGARDLTTVTTRLLQEDLNRAEAGIVAQHLDVEQTLAEQEIERILADHVDRNRNQILRHLARYGNVGRKATERIRADIFQETGTEIPPARIRAALAEFKRWAWESGEIHSARARLQYDLEYQRHAETVYKHLVTSRVRLARAMHVREEQDEGLTFEWAREIAAELEETRGTVLHTPTIVRVLDLVEEREQDVDRICRLNGWPTRADLKLAIQEAEIRTAAEALAMGGTLIYRPDDKIPTAIKDLFPDRIRIMSAEDELRERISAPTPVTE